jgi:hypothetical protein
MYPVRPAVLELPTIVSLVCGFAESSVVFVFVQPARCETSAQGQAERQETKFDAAKRQLLGRETSGNVLVRGRLAHILKATRAPDPPADVFRPQLKAASADCFDGVSL